MYLLAWDFHRSRRWDGEQEEFLRVMGYGPFVDHGNRGSVRKRRTVQL
jgi:hypothetical protein